MINPRDLCLALVQCESEQEIIGVLEKENLWNNQSLWQAFSGEENNFSIIGNQQSKPEAALVEKLTNAVDAVLMSECLARGVDPESVQAPQSMSAALSTYFGITDGKLTNITATNRSELAERILLVATGNRQTPNYAVIDKGEGQSPARLQDTILSLKKSNKLRIPFVQGKFNMGGTGVFRFCGDRNLQLIVSKRNPQISAHETDFDAGKWGFTVVRREDPRGGMRSSSYTYLAPANRIINFEAESLPILPGEYPRAYEAAFAWGTYIKLFEYKIGPSLRTNILFDLYNRLALFLPNIALPIKLCERRDRFRGHSFETVLSGLSVRVDEDRSENVEPAFPTTGTMHVQGQPFVYSIYVFKKGAHEKFTKDEGILFTLNGQTHAILSKQFFDRKAVGLSYVADSIMVILDCSNIDGRAREDLFLNSRDRLGDCPLRRELEKELEDILRNHPGLRAIKDRRRQEELQNRLSEQQPLRNVLQNILKKSPTLARLFISGIAIDDPFATTSARASVEFTGKEFPTFFTATKKYSRERPKTAHIGSKWVSPSSS